MPCVSASLNFANSAKTMDATGAESYVVISDSWLAASSLRRSTRLGTDASLAGIQNRLADSTRNDAASRYGSECTSAIETNNRHRIESQTILGLRRSKRSANAPANGP